MGWLFRRRNGLGRGLFRRRGTVKEVWAPCKSKANVSYNQEVTRGMIDGPFHSAYGANPDSSIGLGNRLGEETD